MLGYKKTQSLLSALAVFAVICVSSIAAVAATGDITADITVTGQVTVNGQAAVSNSTIVSGSTITTGANSTATIGLGKNGRVELLPESSITLRYTDNSIIAMLSSGSVRVMNAVGIGATVTTRTATAVADAGQTNTFTVDIGCGETAKCSQTRVRTDSGLVTLKTSNSSKQVAAGTDSVAGGSQTGCKPCFRPGSAPPVPVAGIGTGALAAILIGAGAAAVAAIIYGKDNDTNQDGGVIVVSPLQ